MISTFTRRFLLSLTILCASALSWVCACSDDEGKVDGEICNAHVECASGLCTVVSLPEAGLALDGGVTPPKRCTPPSL